MPTIPSLERRTVTPQTRIATVDPRGAASLGQAIGSGIDEVKRTYDSYQLADAGSKFSILKNQMDNAFDEGDLEYSTYEERYSQRMEEGLNEIASGISDPSLRNAFMMENQPRVVAGRERVKNKAFVVETDVKRAEVNSRLNGLREVILGNDPDERLQAIRDAKELLAGAKERGYYSAEEMVNLEKTYTVDAALGYVDTLPLSEQRAALNSDLVANTVPSDIVTKRLRGLKGAETREQAQHIARNLLNLSPEKRRKESLKYSGDLYEEIKRQLDAEEAIMKRNKLNADQTFHSDYFMKVLRQEDGFMLEDLLAEKPEAFKGLSQQQKSSLIRAAQGVIKGSSRTTSDPKVIDTLHKLNSEEKYEELRSFYLDNVGMLDSTDMDTWSKISNEGAIPPEYDSKFTLIQQIDMAIADVELKDINLKQEVRRRMKEWDQAYFKKHNDDPDQNAIDNKLKNVIRGVTLGDKGFFGYSEPKDQEGTGWGDETKPRIKMSDEEMETLAIETIFNPEGATKDNLNLVIGEVLELELDGADLGQVMDAGFSQFDQLEEYPKKLLFEKSLTYFEKLQDDNKEMLYETLRAQEPETFQQIVNTLVEENGVMPTPDEVLDGMRFIRDAR